MSDPDMTNSELKIYFEGEFRSVKNDLSDVKNRLDKIEKEIHALGNGKPGIAFRVDRLEKAQEGAKESKKNWASWIIPLLPVLIGSFLGAFFASLF